MIALWMAAPCVAASWIAASDLYSLQTSLGRNWMPEHFWVTSYHRHSTLASQTFEGLYQLGALPQHFRLQFFF